MGRFSMLQSLIVINADPPNLDVPFYVLMAAEVSNRTLNNDYQGNN